MRRIRKLKKHSFRNDFKLYGHFSTMTQDRTNKIGCGMSKYNNDTYLFTCNYSFTNVFGQAIYKVGKTASGCSTGVNTIYPNLCSTNEEIDANLLT